MTKLKVLFLVLYFLLLFLPLIFLNNTGNIFDRETLLRIFGIYGIILLFIQIITGSLMNNFRKIYGPKILTWHILSGLITYLIVLMHPFLFLSILAPQGIFNTLQKMPLEFILFIILGALAIIFLTTGVFAGIFRTGLFITRHWRFFHRANYIAFTFVIIHSYLLGTDSRTIPFIFLYPIFIVGLIASVVYKLKK